MKPGGPRSARRGDAEGTRALIEVLLLHRSMTHEHVVAGIATALRAGALTPDAVAVEARKAAQDDTATDEHSAAASAVSSPPPVTSLTQRRSDHAAAYRHPAAAVGCRL